MRKEPTVPIGPGLFRIYSMCVKRRIPFFGVNEALTPLPQPSFHTENISNPSPSFQAGKKNCRQFWVLQVT